ASLLANSNGTRGFITYGYYSLSIEYSGRDGDNTTGFGYTGFNTLDVASPVMGQAEVRRLLSEAEAQLSPKSVEGKFDGKLLVAPGCLDNFLHYAISLGTSDSALIEKQSPWLDKLNTKVADEKLTVTANPFHKSIVAAGRFNGDGYLSEIQPVIERGTLVSYQLSQYGALKTGNERAKSTNSYIIEPGNTPLAELIASIDDGVLINQFSGGSPSPAGDFSGVAKMSFRIKNGKIAEALTETMISGNLFAMLQNIDGISSETVEDGGGSAPWIVFNGITVS
ncbi:MAG: TldD/PmbA family protein, partial [Oscillospiraceae bacterium]|nr:TldD/PmbA family protein [Oscillospiraceae bacterium]